MWLLPSSACARAAVNQGMTQGVKTGRRGVKVDEDGRSSPPCRSLCSRLRKGAPRPAPLPLNVQRRLVNYPVLLAPSGLAALGHSSRTGLY